MLFFDKLILDLTNPSSDTESDIIDLSLYAGYSVHIILSGTLAADSVLLVGNQPKTNDNLTPDFTSLANSAISLTAGQSFVYNVYWANYRYLKISLSNFAGAGSCKVYINAKEI